MSRQLFYLLLCGCWPQLHRRRRCSRRRPLRLSTGASEGDGEEKRLFKCINVSIVLTYLIFVYSTFLHKHSKDNVCKHIISMVWHSKQNLHSTLTQHESRDLFFHYNRAILSCLVLWSGQWSCNVTIIIPNKSPPLFKAFFFYETVQSGVLSFCWWKPNMTSETAESETKKYSRLVEQEQETEC